MVERLPTKRLSCDVGAHRTVRARLFDCHQYKIAEGQAQTVGQLTSIVFHVRRRFVRHSKVAERMSAMGQSRRFARAGRMSVLTPIATEIAICVHVG
jgi:hypothetical protein